MSHVEAIYQHGVFRPLEKIGLAENQRVRLHVEPVSPSNAQAWLDEAQILQRHFTNRGIVLPASETDIAEDRKR
jgi:predicted DNA-binding antitoxin AbrB/MazE fold protein